MTVSTSLAPRISSGSASAATELNEMPVAHPWDTTVPRILSRWAELRPDAIAIASPLRPSLSYGALRDQVNATDVALRGIGIKRTDFVVLAIPQGPEAAVAFLSVSCSAVAAPLNPKLPPQEFEHLFDELRPKAVLVPHGQESAARLAAVRSGIAILEVVADKQSPAGQFEIAAKHSAVGTAPSAARPRDLALILPTSGTTSGSKLVPLTHRNICAAALNTSCALGLGGNDRCLNPMPLFHGHGLVAAVLASTAAGASVMCTPPFEAARFFDWMQEYEPTWYTAVPAIHAAVLGESVKNPDIVRKNRLRVIRSASSYLSAETRAALERTFNVPVSESYGLSEALQLTNTPLDHRLRRVGSLGVVGTSEVAIVDDQLARLAPGEVGEIVCRGPIVTSGYLNRPLENEQAFVEGWFRTGDLGRLDADGHLYLVGRLKEQINRGGEKVSPLEIDAVLAEHPAVAQAISFGISDPLLGEDIAAAVVLRPNGAATPQEIRRFAVARLPEFKVPRKIFIVDQVPISAMGKPLRRELAAQFDSRRIVEASSSSDAAGAPRKASAQEQQMIALWEHVLERRPVQLSDDFFELGGNSLRAAQLILEIERACGRRLDPMVLYSAPTVRELVRHLFDAPDPSTSDRPVIEMQSGGTGIPMVFLTGDYSRTAVYCRNLVARLSSDQPFYALMPLRVDTPGAPQSIEAMATAFIQSVREVLPQGPYVLAGFSHASLVALEMAQQWTLRGEQIPQLLVIDMPVASPRLRVLRRMVDVFAHVASLTPEQSAQIYLDWRDRLERFWSLLGRGMKPALHYYWSRAAGRIATQTPQPHLPSFLQHTAATYSRIIKKYIPRRYNGRITLITSSDGPARHANDETLGWRNITSELTRYSISGDHWSCVTEHVDELAARIRNTLAEVGKGDAAGTGLQKLTDR